MISLTKNSVPFLLLDNPSILSLVMWCIALVSSVIITGGSITGITDLLVADGGTGASTLTGV